VADADLPHRAFCAGRRRPALSTCRRCDTANGKIDAERRKHEGASLKATLSAGKLSYRLLPSAHSNRTTSRTLCPRAEHCPHTHTRAATPPCALTDTTHSAHTCPALRRHHRCLPHPPQRLLPFCTPLLPLPTNTACATRFIRLHTYWRQALRAPPSNVHLPAGCMVVLAFSDDKQTFLAARLASGGQNGGVALALLFGSEPPVPQQQLSGSRMGTRTSVAFRLPHSAPG